MLHYLMTAVCDCMCDYVSYLLEHPNSASMSNISKKSSRNMEFCGLFDPFSDLHWKKIHFRKKDLMF